MPVFNQARAKFYPFNEVYLEAPKKEKKVAGDSPAKHKYIYIKLDSYVPNTEIVSRKYTRLSEVSEETAIRYLKELTDKYASITKTNNYGKKPDTRNTYIGKSKDRKVTINFFYEQGEITSYYPILTE